MTTTSRWLLVGVALTSLLACRTGKTEVAAATADAETPATPDPTATTATTADASTPPPPKASFSATAKSTPAGMVIDRPMYTVTYPPAWKLDEKDEDFDLDHYFSIEAPGSCHVSFFLYASRVNEKTNIDLQTSKMKEAVFKGDPTAVPFGTWGTLTGTGVELRGKMKPVSKGRVRIFMHAEATRSVLVNEFCFDEDLPAAQPGFDLVSSSFRFH